MAQTGIVFDIQHFAIHDGPGIRTTVFLKGCPLRCLWCHNPEGQSPQPEILFSPEKCIGCQACERVCPRGAHAFLAGDAPGMLRHIFRREACDGCGLCAGECYSGALELCGRAMTSGEVLAAALTDRPFYTHSGGGLTLSGGEPAQQASFALALLREARAAGLHTVIETSGACATSRYLALLPFVDLFYFDIKETDPARHRRYTGSTNRLALRNLRALAAAGAALVLRCPVIPGLNDRPDHLAGIAALAEELPGVQAVHILPYHALGTHKLQRMGQAQAFHPPDRPGDDQVAGWVQAVQRLTRVAVVRD